MSGAKSVPYCVGKWLPSDQAVIDTWLLGMLKEVNGKKQVNGTKEVTVTDRDADFETGDLLPPIKDLQQLIETDPHINMLFHQMFEQVPLKYKDSSVRRQRVLDYRQMLCLLNVIVTRAPDFNQTALCGCPITIVLDWSVGTAAGFTASLNDKVIAHFKKIQNYWATFLKLPDSRYVLSDDPEKGWFGENAMKAMPDFAQLYKCDPSKPHYGFASWDDFFTREFRDGVRPIADPCDNRVIVNACESAPYMIQHNVSRRSQFWIKAQPYSICFMLANDSLADQFVGGTVYQAFLGPTCYHRWHSPVGGKIVKAFLKDGSYYSQLPMEPCNEEGQCVSMSFLTEVATRALIFIEVDNPHIGLMCFVGVGMGEVSSCDITVYEGQQVKKGQQLGMFHFGGSTYCLVFSAGVDVKFDLHGQEPGLGAMDIPVNSRIANVPS